MARAISLALIGGLLSLSACSVAGKEWVDAGQDREESSAAPLPPEAAQESGQPGQPQPNEGPTKSVYLQPLGQELPLQAVALVETALREFYGFEVRRANPLPLPRAAFYAPRRRYRAEKLLLFLDQVGPRQADRILGLTGVDISTTKGRIQDWGIMGLATIDGRVSVMSMFRCRRGARNEQHARERLGKVAVHEVGHTLGLEHCPTVGCLMEDARGTNTTTDREYVLCPRCRALLTQAGFSLPSNPAPPWPNPSAR